MTVGLDTSMGFLFCNLMVRLDSKLDLMCQSIRSIKGKFILILSQPVFASSFMTKYNLLRKIEIKKDRHNLS